MVEKDVQQYLPLTESTYYIMLALQEPAHGYRVIQMVEEMSQGLVRMGPGTLYGVFSTLEKEGLILKTGEEERRKYYTLTENGKCVLEGQLRRLEAMLAAGKTVKSTTD